MSEAPKRAMFGWRPFLLGILAGFVLCVLVLLTAYAIVLRQVRPEVWGEWRRVRAAADIEMLSHALNVYKLKVGRYPATQQGLSVLWSNSTGLQLIDTHDLRDPWGHPYVYMSPGERGRPFEVVSYGSDGAKGGSGSAADIDLKNSAQILTGHKFERTTVQLIPGQP